MTLWFKYIYIPYCYIKLKGTLENISYNNKIKCQYPRYINHSQRSASKKTINPIKNWGEEMNKQNTFLKETDIQ